MAFINGTHYDEFVFPGGTQKFIDGKVLDQFAWSQYDYDEKASRAATPIGYTWVADGIYKWELPIYNLSDVSPNNMRIYTGSVTGCFSLVDTSHPASSNLRFYDGTNTKCFYSTSSVQYDFPPTVGDPYHDPPVPSDSDAIRFYATASDSEGEVVSANLIWTTDAWATEYIVSMVLNTNWVANLSAQTVGSIVEYKVVAWDDKWQSATSSISGFTVTNPKK